VTAELTISRHDGAGALELQDELVSLYSASHGDVVHIPFMSPERYRQRLVDMYAPLAGFELVTGRLDGELAGYAFGSPRPNSASTWEDLRRARPDLPVPSTPLPIYIFREFAVHPEHQGRGYGRLLHDALLGPRTEPLAHLLVRQDNDRARYAYQKWGWEGAGTLQPFPDAPVFDVMVRRLPLLPR
jgi:GNAT superfamily N-acetyltransferase